MISRVAVLFMFILTFCDTIEYTSQDVVTKRDTNLQFIQADPIYIPVIDDLTFDIMVDVKFHIYTRHNQKTPSILHLNSIKKFNTTFFDVNNPTVMLFHGWRNNPRSRFNTEIRNAYLKNGNYNVIVVDWERGANSNYLTSAMRVNDIGIYVALIIDKFVTLKYIDLSKLTFIGHSLGAHVAGVVGRRITGFVKELIALDPAGPLFSYPLAMFRVAPSDAKYVMAIHTNGGKLGMLEPVGDGDFYPNGGKLQPGCGMDVVGLCSHRRVVNYYVESLYSTEGFWSLECKSFGQVKDGQCNKKHAKSEELVLMPGELNENTTDVKGIFYFRTNSNTPFARGKKGV